MSDRSDPGFLGPDKSHPDVVRVVVVDDEALVRRRLLVALEAVDDLDVVGEAADAESALARVGETTTDVVVLDARGAGQRAAALCVAVRDRFPSTALLVRGSAGDGPEAVRLLRAGAGGVIDRDAPDRELVAAVRRIAAGWPVLGATAAEAVLREVARTAREAESVTADFPAVPLDDTTRDLLDALAGGADLTVAAAAVDLPVPVAAHRVADVVDALGRRGRAEAQLLAARDRPVVDRR